MPVSINPICMICAVIHCASQLRWHQQVHVGSGVYEWGPLVWDEGVWDDGWLCLPSNRAHGFLIYACVSVKVDAIHSFGNKQNAQLAVTQQNRGVNRCACVFVRCMPPQLAVRSHSILKLFFLLLLTRLLFILMLQLIVFSTGESARQLLSIRQPHPESRAEASAGKCSAIILHRLTSVFSAVSRSIWVSSSNVMIGAPLTLPLHSLCCWTP